MLLETTMKRTRPEFNQHEVLRYAL